MNFAQKGLIFKYVSPAQNTEDWLDSISKEHHMAKAGAKKKQARLPGTEQPSIPEIDEAAGALIAANSERGAASQRVKQAQEQLLKALKAAGKEHYKADGIEAWVDHGPEKAKAKEVAQPEGEE